MNIKPIAGSKNRVVVSQVEQTEEITKGGIIIPLMFLDKPQHGKVIAISDVDENGIKPVVKVGDIILYDKTKVVEVKIEDIDYLIMRELDIFAVVGLGSIGLGSLIKMKKF